MQSTINWINELKDAQSIINKRDEMIDNLNNYIRLKDMYNWKDSVVRDNINNMMKSIDTYNRYLNNL